MDKNEKIPTNKSLDNSKNISANNDQSKKVTKEKLDNKETKLTKDNDLLCGETGHF